MIIFYLKESLKLISRAKASFLLALLASTLSIGLIAVSAVLLILSNEFQNRLKENIRMGIFLEEELSAAEKADIKKEIEQTGYFSTIIYISKDKAAERFIKETGEDFRQILDYNPLPSSFDAKVNKNFVNNSELTRIKKEILKIGGVDEVILDERITAKILDFLYSSRTIIFIATAFLLLISIYIISSTTKLLLSRKYEELETMKLVGAKLIAIKAPVYLNSLLIGLLASIIIIIVGYFSSVYFLNGSILKLFSSISLSLIAIFLLLLGPGLSFVVTIFSLKKVSLKI